MDNSVNRNMILNILKTFLSVLFPLITYPYATRVLGVENFGKVSYTSSIISYFMLFAGMGISNYAIREGGYIRINEKKIQKFSSEIFTLNIIFTFMSYIGLIMLIVFNPNLYSYRMLLLIQSISILFITFGVDWLNVIYEDYVYITVRSICIQFISLFFLFLFVKSDKDYLLYGAMSVISNGLIAIFNIINIRKKIKFGICAPQIKKHIKPIIILFSNSLAVSIYCNIDITMVGWICGDYYVGLYSLVSKIYSILKQMIAAAYTVTITRLSQYWGNGELQKYKQLLNSTILNVFILAIPIGIMVFEWSEQILYLIGGKEFDIAKSSLQILSITIVIAVLGGALAYCVNMPMRRENVNLLSTAVGALENLLLNIIVIPKYGINGAAYTTLLAECTVVVVLIFSIRNKLDVIDIRYLINNITKTFIACIPIFILSNFLKNFGKKDSLIGILAICILSVVLYIILGICLKNDGISNMVSFVNKKK